MIYTWSDRLIVQLLETQAVGLTGKVRCILTIPFQPHAAMSGMENGVGDFQAQAMIAD